MANCMTCRHNDKKAKYCPVKKAHTDLGYVLNCIAWAPTDEAEMKRFRAENAKLRELAVRMFHTIEWSDRMSDSMYWPSFSYKRELRDLGVEVDG